MTAVTDQDIARACERLGAHQVALLGCLLGRHHGWHESYWPGDGWTYSTPGETRRLLRSLAARGLVTSCRVPGPGREVEGTRDRYALTDLGRAVGRHHFPSARPV